MAKKQSKGDPVLDALKKASRGLEFVSESEAPLEPFLWEGGGPARMTNKRLCELAGEESGAEVEQQSLDDFFLAVPPEDKEKFDKLAGC